MMRLKKILITIAMIFPLTALCGVVGGSNGGSSQLKLTTQEYAELNAIIQEQEVAYLETESRTLEVSKASDTKLKAIDIDTFEIIVLEVAK